MVSLDSIVKGLKIAPIVLALWACNSHPRYVVGELVEKDPPKSYESRGTPFTPFWADDKHRSAFDSEIYEITIKTDKGKRKFYADAKKSYSNLKKGDRLLIDLGKDYERDWIDEERNKDYAKNGFFKIVNP